MIVKDTFDLIASLFSFYFIFFLFFVSRCVEPSGEITREIKNVVLKDRSRDSQFLTSFFLQSSTETKSSRSRNFNMDRLFDKKKIVNLQIAVEVTRSSRKFSLFNLTYKTVSRRITARSRKVKSISLFSIKNPIESQRSRCTTPRIKSALHVRKTFFRGSLGARSAGLFCFLSLFLSPSRETRSIQFNRVTRLT